MPSVPQLVHDGCRQLDELPPTEVERPCPTCGEACTFDAVDVVGTGAAIGWATSASVERLQRHVLRSLPFVVGEFDTKRTLCSVDGCSPHVRSIVCPACGAPCLAVVSYGEVQPARWRLVVNGIVPGVGA